MPYPVNYYPTMGNYPQYVGQPPYSQGSFSMQNIPPVPPTGPELVTVQTVGQVEQVGLQPGQRKIVMVQNEPVIAARSADNMGLVSTEYYHLEKFDPTVSASAPAAEYITRKEFNEFVESLKPTKKATKKEDEE